MMAILSRRLHKGVYVSITVFLILCATFARYVLPSGVGDTGAYVLAFANIDQFSVYSMPAFYFIAKLVHGVGFASWTLFFIYSILAIAPAVYFIKKYAVNPSVSLFVYLGLYFILEPMIQIRAAVANIIFLFALNDLFYGHKKKFLLKLIFASLFHYSSLLFIPLVLLSRRKFNYIYYATLLLVSVVLFVFRGEIYPEINRLLSELVPILPSILSLKLNSYLLQQHSGNITSASNITFFDLYLLGSVPIFFFLLSNSKALFSISAKNIIYLKSYIYGIILFLAFSAVPVMAGRVSLFLMIPAIILYGDMCNLFKERIFIKMFVIIFSLTYGVLFLCRVYFGLSL